jgi:two-component system cell cycle response regulator DivK
MVEPDQACVLVIEDDINNLLVVTDFLQMMGVKEVHSRLEGWQGLQLAQTLTNLDLILLDIQLPNEDGYALLKQIRSIPSLNHIRVVAVTANVLPQDEARAREAGFDGFIGKPLDFDRFPHQIRAILRGDQVWMAR